jgi:hypothetical protein
VDRLYPLSMRSTQSLKVFYDQQFWCWGQDIQHPEGSRLRHLGFERFVSDTALTNSRAYRLALDGNSQIVLWAFGAYISGPEGGLYLSRAKMRPLFTRLRGLPDLFLPLTREELFREATPRTQLACRKLVSTLFAWIAGYEAWIQASQVAGYRECQMLDWKRSIVPGENMASAWQFVSRELAPDFSATHRPLSHLGAALLGDRDLLRIS